MIVTGAGSGIGRATASRVAREGGRVIAVDISGERLDEFIAEIPDLDIIPGMLERAAGSIVNVASEASLRGSAAGAAYTASKPAIVGLTKNSAFMYGASGVRVNAVAPGPVR